MIHTNKKKKRYVCVVGFEHKLPPCAWCPAVSTVSVSGVQALCYCLGVCFLLCRRFHQRCRTLHSFSSTCFLSSLSCVAFFQGSVQKTLRSPSCFCPRWSALRSPAGGRRRKLSGGSSSCVLASGSAPEVLPSFWTAVDDEPVKIQQWEEKLK